MNEVMVSENEKFVTTKELAEVLGVSERTIRDTATAKGLEGTFHTLQTNGGKQSLRVFSEEDATIIKQEIQKHHNLATRQIDSVSTELEENQMIAKAWSILQRRVADAEKEVERLRPAAMFAYQICSSKDAIDIGNCAKVLNRNIGRNNLFEFLRNKKILQQDNIPYQKFIDSGYFRVIETKYTIPSGETKISLKTLVLQKGVAYINKLLAKEAEGEN